MNGPPPAGLPPPVLPGARRRPVGKTTPIEARRRLPEGVEGRPAGQGRDPKGRFLRRGTGIGAPGMSHQQRVGYWLERRYGAENVVHEVRIRPYRDAVSGTLDEAIRVDHVVRDPVTGELSYWDSKQSTGASRTRQNNRYAKLERFGGEVRSTGKGWLEQGDDVDPGKVTKVLPTHEEIAELKRGMPATADRGTAAATRATGDAERGTATASDAPGDSPVDAEADVTPDKPRARFDTPEFDVRVRISKAGFRFIRGMALDMVIGIVVGLFVSYFERQAAKETQARVREFWRDKLFPQLEPLLQKEMQTSAAGLRPRARRRYLGVVWTLVTRELDEDFSDAVVWAGKFAAGSPGFGEVYDHIEHQDQTYFRESSNRVASEADKRERDRNSSNLLRYRFTTWILVHDPSVLAVVRWLQAEHNARERELQQAERLYSALDPTLRLATSISAVDSALKRRGYVTAAGIARLMVDQLARDVGVSANPVARLLRQLAVELDRMPLRIVERAKGMDADQRRLLDTQIGMRLVARD